MRILYCVEFRQIVYCEYRDRKYNLDLWILSEMKLSWMKLLWLNFEQQRINNYKDKSLEQ